MKRLGYMNSAVMDRTISHKWFAALFLASIFTGCGGGGGNPILGGAGIGGAGAGVAVLAPGAVCAVAGATIPTVTVADPTSGNQFVTTSTNGVAGSGKNINATFSLPMLATSINPISFTLKPSGGAILVPASVSYVASTKVATLTTSAALLANTTYVVVISTVATSSTGVPMACSFSWSFKTTAAATTGLPSVNLGNATSFAIASAAGLTTAAGGVPHINGDVVLNPLAQCNAVNVDNTGGFGACGSPGLPVPTLTGTVISHLFDKGVPPSVIMADLTTAYNGLMAANLPGATVLGCSEIGTGGGGGALIGCAGNATLPPGVYTGAPSIGVTGILTLDGQGDSNARFVFQMPSSTLTAAVGALGAPGSQIVLINGAKASNVWWQVGSSATINAYSVFNGNILASSTITVDTGATSCGRLLAAASGAGALTLMGSAVVSVPGNASAPPGCQ